MTDHLGLSETSRQTYSRWFTVWPTTHVNAGQSVEVMPVAEHERLMANRCACRVTCGDVPEDAPGQELATCKGLPR